MTKLKFLLLVGILAISGCMSASDRQNVTLSTKIAIVAADKYDPAKPPDPKDIKLFLDNNAKCWNQFNIAVNGKDMMPVPPVATNGPAATVPK